jgi:hypothetical protein
MAVDLAKLGNVEPQASLETSIGELCVFEITMRGQSALHKELGTSIGECDPFDFVRKFARQTCFKRESLRDGKYRPAMPSLSADDAASLTDVDLERIANAYVAKNESLFKKQVSKKSVDATGKEMVFFEYGEVEHPRKEQETASQYLQRLFVLQNEKLSRWMDSAFGLSLTGLGNFSQSLGDSMKSSLLLGESLRRSWETMRLGHLAYVTPIAPAVPEINVERLDRLVAEARETPFRELASRLDRLIETSAEQGGFLVNANKIQTEIAGELKASGDTTRDAAKKNIALTGIVIILSLLGVGMSVYAVRRAKSESEVQRRETTNHVNRVVDELAGIRAGTAPQDDSLKKVNERLKTEAAKQRREIDEMQLRLRRQDSRLLELEAKLRTRAPNE